jgi:hypothetical protein
MIHPETNGQLVLKTRRGNADYEDSLPVLHINNSFTIVT